MVSNCPTSNCQEVFFSFRHGNPLLLVFFRYWFPCFLTLFILTSFHTQSLGHIDWWTGYQYDEVCGGRRAVWRDTDREKNQSHLAAGEVPAVHFFWQTNKLRERARERYNVLCCSTTHVQWPLNRTEADHPSKVTRLGLANTQCLAFMKNHKVWLICFILQVVALPVDVYSLTGSTGLPAR